MESVPWKVNANLHSLKIVIYFAWFEMRTGVKWPLSSLYVTLFCTLYLLHYYSSMIICDVYIIGQWYHGDTNLKFHRALHQLLVICKETTFYQLLPPMSYCLLFVWMTFPLRELGKLTQGYINTKLTTANLSHTNICSSMIIKWHK